MARLKIVIAPIGGLCNRMQATASAIGLAESINAELEIHWYRSPNINIAFDDLFVVPGAVARIREFDLYTKRGRFKRKLGRKYYQRSYDRYLKYSSQMPDPAEVEKAASAGRVFITAYRCFYESPSALSQLIPADPVRKIIESEAPSPDVTVAMHVRRADHDLAINHSPTGVFVELIEQEIGEDPEARFFLATDSPDVEKELKASFPGRISSYEKRSLDRNDREAIEDAVVDLYCLSRCRKLIGSYDSSFSETAAKLGDIPLLTAYRP